MSSGTQVGGRHGGKRPGGAAATYWAWAQWRPTTWGFEELGEGSVLKAILASVQCLSAVHLEVIPGGRNQCVDRVSSAPSNQRTLRTNAMYVERSRRSDFDAQDLGVEARKCLNLILGCLEPKFILSSGSTWSCVRA